MTPTNHLAPPVQIGCCCRIEESEQAQAAGFDYLECPVTALMREEAGATWEIELQRYRQAALPVRAFNIFLPGELKVVGPDVDFSRVEQYIATALPRVRAVGAERVVFGSGRSRHKPDDFAPAQAWEQLIQFLQMTGEIAGQEGLTIAIEPLNRRESNILNSVGEAAELAAQVDRPAVRVLADLYHMQEEDEALDEVLRWGEWLAHIHVADSGRGAPGTGAYPYTEFFRLLHAAGYGQGETAMISIECRWQDFAQEAPKAVETLRSHWAATVDGSSSQAQA